MTKKRKSQSGGPKRKKTKNAQKNAQKSSVNRWVEREPLPPAQKALFLIKISLYKKTTLLKTGGSKVFWSPQTTLRLNFENSGWSLDRSEEVPRWSADGISCALQPKKRSLENYYRVNTPLRTGFLKVLNIITTP